MLYVGSDETRIADARLLESWMSYNESHAAVLDQVFWKSEANSASVAEAETVPSPDPRLDHMGVRVSNLSDRIGPMPIWRRSAPRCASGWTSGMTSEMRGKNQYREL